MTMDYSYFYFMAYLRGIGIDLDTRCSFLLPYIVIGLCRHCILYFLCCFSILASYYRVALFLKFRLSNDWFITLGIYLSNYLLDTVDLSIYWFLFLLKERNRFKYSLSIKQLTQFTLLSSSFNLIQYRCFFYLHG